MLELEEMKVQIENIRYFCREMLSSEKYRSFAKATLEALEKLDIRLQKIYDRLKSEVEKY